MMFGDIMFPSLVAEGELYSLIRIDHPGLPGSRDGVELALVGLVGRLKRRLDQIADRSHAVCDPEGHCRVIRKASCVRHRL